MLEMLAGVMTAWWPRPCIDPDGWLWVIHGRHVDGFEQQSSNSCIAQLVEDIHVQILEPFSIVAHCRIRADC